jgi:hypothetical protein
MKPAPTFPEVEAKLTALTAGRISREEADWWAGEWVYASESREMLAAVWNALLHLAGCDLRHGPGDEYLHAVEQFESGWRNCGLMSVSQRSSRCQSK